MSCPCDESLREHSCDSRCEHALDKHALVRELSVGECDVCGKENVHINVRASIMGPVSFAYCDDCLDKGLEPYGAMVSYIACAGHFPEDINPAYQDHVRKILKGLGKSEEEFIKDVNDAIKDLESL